ncbi:MAG: hypothetical protein ACK4YP_19935, partial [Myxococcota bacterium]
MLLLALFVSCAPADLAPADPVAADAGEDPSADWFATVRARLRGDARAIRPDGAGLAARHASLGAIARFDTDGASFAFTDGPTVRVGIGGGARSVALGACQADGAEDVNGDCLRRAEIDHGDVVEWWESGERGFEHGFHVPSGGAEVRLAVDVEGADTVAT